MTNENLGTSDEKNKGSGTMDKVKKLRKETGLGVTECRNALLEAGGDMEKAKQVLEAKNAEIAEKKVMRETKSGIISSYIHKTKNTSPQKGALIDLRCESDYVALRPEFATLAKNLCMEIVIHQSDYLSRYNVPESLWIEHRELEFKKALYEQPQLSMEELEAKSQEKTTAYFDSKCLLVQRYSKDETLSIEDYVASHIALFKENIQIHRFQRFEI